MPIGLSAEHEQFRETIGRWCEENCSSDFVRSRIGAEPNSLAPFWRKLAETGWIGLATPLEFGGSGHGALEVAVVLEELSRHLGPGPLATSALACHLVTRFARPELRETLVPRIITGEVSVAVAFGEGSLFGRWEGADLLITGTLTPLLHGSFVDQYLVPVGTDTGTVWALVHRLGAVVHTLESVDPTRDIASISLQNHKVPMADLLTGMTLEHVRYLSCSLLSAEAAGIARACLDAALHYAKIRVQFDQPIGQFQTVKHALVEMLLDVERTVSAAWGAARAIDRSDDEQVAFSVDLAGSICFRAASTCAKQNIQLHGAVGFTWEHDAHLLLKRTLSIHQLMGGHVQSQRRVARAALNGTRRLRYVPTSRSADDYRSEIRECFQAMVGESPEVQYRQLADAGLLDPQWPPPWGRGATALEQLVVEDEFRQAGIEQPYLEHIAFIVPLLISQASDEQKERWIWPTIRREISWCQMFSEPDAGSDLASLSTKAVRVDGGWRITGQKIWTTRAHTAQLAVCLARTTAERPKRMGITCFAVRTDDPGIEIRPLIEMTGVHHFNEVYLNEAWVPDEDVIGDVDDGWNVAKATLVHERISMATATPLGDVSEHLIELVASRPNFADDVGVQGRLGELVTESQVCAIMAERSALRAIDSGAPGSESSILKLMRNEHDQKLSEFGMELLGMESAASEGTAANWVFRVLYSRCLTIAGGTSQIQRNVIGERLLGLPRDLLAR